MTGLVRRFSRRRNMFSKRIHCCYIVIGREFNSDDHYIYYCGQESLGRNAVAIMVNKRVWDTVLGCNLKNDRVISVRRQGEPFIITVIQVYAPTSNTEETEVERFYEDLQDLLELTLTLKKMSFSSEIADTSPPPS